MADIRLGRQTPTKGVSLPYEVTHGQQAIDLYNATGRTAQPWQELLIYDIMARNDEGLWVHTKFGEAVPRRNGKNEVVAIRELAGVIQLGEHILHTAHRTTTSSAASRRLAALLSDLGYEEVVRVKKDAVYDKHFTYTKQMGMEKITVLGEGGGTVDFRTRSAKGGLGEGFDLLIIDEAQEYTDDQESALKYVVSDSQNPQTLMCGTPPTPVSSGTVFLKLRNAALQGETQNTGWAEWSVDRQTDPNDREAWYETNPSLGTILTERKIADETGGDVVDFNIQRLGLWLRYNQKSVISKREWEALKREVLPELKGKLFAGIKYGVGSDSVALSIAVKTADDHILIESIDCRPVRAGDQWILSFLAAAQTAAAAVDGASGQQLLCNGMKERGLKAPKLPTVKEIIAANAEFLQKGIAEGQICHLGQPSLAQVIGNCEKRAIGSGGGFGFRSLLDGAAVELMDSAILAYWLCANHKERKKQTVSY